MRSLTLTEPADFGVLFDVARRSYTDEAWQRMTRGLVDRDTFIATCLKLGYPSLGFLCDGVPIGGMMFDGQAAHIGVFPEYQGRWAFLWEDACKWLFAIRDPFVVRIEPDNAKCIRFVERNGWKRVSEDAQFVYYEISSQGRRRRRQREHTSCSSIPMSTEA
jgi:hypothetical protein